MKHYILESYLLSDETIMIDFDKFVNGGRLFIIGMSGSGKTTIANIIEKKFNASICSLDSAWLGSDRRIKNRPKKTHEIKKWNKAAHAQMVEMVKDRRCRVVEGIQLVFPPLVKTSRPYIMNEACIIMGKSVIKSTFDGAIRNAKALGWKIFLKALRGEYRTNVGLVKGIENFRKFRIKRAKSVSKFSV